MKDGENQLRDNAKERERERKLVFFVLYNLININYSKINK